MSSILRSLTRCTRRCVVAYACLATAMAQNPARISIPELTSDSPETAMRALQRFELATEPEAERDSYVTDFAKFSNRHADLRVQPIGRPGSPPIQYLVAWRFGLGSELVVPHEQRAALFAPDVASAPVLLPEADIWGEVFGADGINNASIMVSHGVAADLNADGKVDVADCTDTNCDIEISGARETVSVSSLSIRPAIRPRESQLKILLNPVYRERPISKLWGWRFVDEDRDGVFVLQLGEVSAAGMKVEVALHWDAIKRRWVGPDPAPEQPYVIIRDQESESSAMARAGWTKFVARLSAAPPVPPEVPDFWHIDDMTVDDLSHPYRYVSLAGRSDAELLEFMLADRDVYDVVQERAEKIAAIPDFWNSEPRKNALATIYANRPVKVRDREAFALDLSDGKQAPEKGDLTLDDGPSGCFAPSGAFVQHLHCDPAGSYLLLASNLMPWDGIAATEMRKVFNFRKVAVTYADARQFLQTVWFMLRARTFPSASKPSGDQGGGSTSDGWATLHLTSPGESTIASGTRFESHPGNSAGLSSDGDGLDQTALLNMVVRLFAQEWPARLGDRWKPDYPDTGLVYNEPPPKPSDDEVAAVHGMAAEFLRLYFAGQAPPVFADEAISAAMELGFDDLRNGIAKVPDDLPPPTATEITVKKIDAEIKPWIKKHGEALASEIASSRRRWAPLSLPSATGAAIPLIPGFDTSDEGAGSKPTPEKMEAAEQRKIFAPLDALYERRSDLLYIETSTPERMAMELRSAAPLAVQYLEARNDPRVLRDLLIENQTLVEIGLPQLARLDRNAAVEVLRATRKEELKIRFRPEGLAMEKLGAGLEATPEETRFKAIIEGREQLTPENVSIALSRPPNDFTIWDDYARALALVVPPTEPQRYTFPEINQELGRLMAEAKRENEYHIPDDAVALACARRGIPGAWDGIDTWGALALLVRLHPDENRSRFIERVKMNLSESKGALDEMFFATWLADARELKPALEKVATSGPGDAEGLMSSWHSTAVAPVKHRFHGARRAVSIWNEEDPATRARLLIGFALRRPDQFDPQTQPEAWQLFHDQLLAALSQLDATARASMREFFDFAQREIQQRRKWIGHDPKRDVPFLSALGKALE